jgi:large subunit ribosomal protein L24
MKIKKQDMVLITAGKDKGKKGKVLQVFPEQKKLMIEGINLKKKHRRPKKSGEKGQIVILPGPVDVSNLKLICSKCAKPARTGYQIDGKKKKRICKKCQQET